MTRKCCIRYFILGICNNISTSKELYANYISKLNNLFDTVKLSNSQNCLNTKFYVRVSACPGELINILCQLIYYGIIMQWHIIQKTSVGKRVGLSISLLCHQNAFLLVLHIFSNGSSWSKQTIPQLFLFYFTAIEISEFILPLKR